MSSTKSYEPPERQRLLPSPTPAPGFPAHAHALTYNAGRRSWNDVSWLATFAFMFFSALAGGLYAYQNRTPNFVELISPEHLKDPASCPLHGGRSLLAENPDQQWRLDALLMHGALWSSATVAGSLAVAGGFMLMLRRSARMLVGTAIALQVLLPLLGAAAAFANGAPAGGVSLLLLSSLLVLLFVLWREQVELVTRLLGVAGHALLANLGLVAVAIGLQLAMLVAAAPLVAGIALAMANGSVVPNPQRVDVPGSGNQATCVDADGQPVMCCTWQVEPWVPLYAAWALLSLLWTTFLAFEIKVFTVSGTVAQWYFAPVSALHAAAPQGSRALRSLRHALGPSLGSLCLGSAILTLMSLLRQALQKAREEAGRNAVMWLVATVLSFAYAVIEFLTKFATVRMAMTGERFVDAGRGVVALLSRNAMDAFGVWWLPPLILQNCAVVAAAAWGFCMWGVGGWQFGPQETGPASATALGVLAFLCGWAVLAFCCALLLNVVDAVFVCFAVDRDTHAVTMIEVHEVVGKLPTVGPVVEQPNGHFAYANPQMA